MGSIVLDRVPPAGRTVTTAAKRKLGRADIPSLDGLRAVSILLVLAAHCDGTRGFPSGLPHRIVDHGVMGVQIFFVISGYLITSLLLREKSTTGDISLNLFYARRTLRIFPAFWLFLLTTALLSALGAITRPRYNLLYAATYTVNYGTHGTWWTGHLWSLSVEEQFYFVWPALICLLGTRSAIAAAAAIAVGSPIVLRSLHVLDVPNAGQISMWFPLVADSIASGCVLAGLLPFLRERPWFQKAIRSRLGLAVPIAVFLIDCLRAHPKLFLPFGEWALNLSIAYCVARFTEFPSDAAGRLLNWRPLVFLGSLSYSLYLWQQPFINRYSTAPWTAFPLNCCGAFVLACFSNYIVERPFLRLRRRFQPVIPPPIECQKA